jgi:hypothetical protein
MNKIFNRDGVPIDRLGQAGMLISRLVIGYLWFTQLRWKMPPTFGCPADFSVSTSLSARTSGLCDWTGLMAMYSKAPLHASFVDSVIIPNISWMGWGIWLMEAFIAITLILGLFSRLGGFVALIQSINLYIGLTALPIEWYWTYGMLCVLSLIFFTVPPGRIFGVDTWLRPRFQKAAGQNKSLAKVALLFT